jgi:tetratricopeptide (TPR) repeat protein
MSLGFAPTQSAEASEFDPKLEFRNGVELLKNEYPQKALVKLRRAFESDKQNAYFSSFLGVAVARAQRKWDLAIELCEMAVQQKPKELQFHLNLGEVYSLSGRREKALDKLDYALSIFGNAPRLVQARSRVAKRRQPVFSVLKRGHFLNRQAGKLRHKVLKGLDE